MATLNDVLSRGYFPKELPPPFTTTQYASALSGTIPAIFKTGGGPRKSVRHNLGRPGTLVRTLSVPDPLHFYRLAELMIREWDAISARVSASQLSLTSPVDDRLKLRAWSPRERPSRFEARAHHAAYANVRLEADVSQWYPSTYTHSLDWAIRGKEEAKRDSRRRGGLGPLLDTHVRQSQDRQSIGLPIGPDTSLVLGELVLSQVDVEFLSLAPSAIHGFRYYDDYEIFAPNRDAAGRAIDALVQALSDWQLILNPRKVAITSLPLPIEDEWTSVLKRIHIRNDHPSQEKSDLNALFDEAFRLAKQFPTEQILAYMLGHFISRANGERHRVHVWNWRHLEKLLLQATLGEPGVLSKVGHMLFWSKERGLRLDTEVLEAALNLIASEHAARGNGNEVAWALWLAVQLDIPIRAAAVRSIERLHDDVVALTALHAVEAGSIKRVDASRWASLVSHESLVGDHWLLAYEASVHGWLPSVDGSDVVGRDDSFSYLRAQEVRFYDGAATLPEPAIVGLTLPPVGAAGPVSFLGGPEPSDEEDTGLYA